MASIIIGNNDNTTKDSGSTLHLLAHTGFYLNKSVSVTAGNRIYKEVFSITVSKKYDNSTIIISGGGLIKVNNTVCGFAVQMNNTHQELALTDITNYVFQYGNATFDNVPSGSQDVIFEVFAEAYNGGKATATLSTYQWLPLSVFEVY